MIPDENNQNSKGLLYLLQPAEKTRIASKTFRIGHIEQGY